MGYLLRHGHGGLILRVQRRGAVQQQQRQRGPLRRLAAARYAQLLHGVARLPDARRIRQPQQHMAQQQLLLHRIPGGARHVGDDGPVKAHQGVQQRGFAHVGLAQQHRGHPLLHQLATGEGGQQLRQLVLAPAQGVQQMLTLQILDILVGIVHDGIEPAGHIHQRIVHRLDAAAQDAVQLSGGVAGGLGRLRVDDVHHGLRLQQIHPAVEKGPLGEFAAPGLPRPVVQQQLQPLGQYDGRAVAMDLGAVFTGVAAGAGEQHAQRTVQHAALAVQQVAQHHGTGCLLGHGLIVQREKHRIQHVFGLRAAEPQDADGAGRQRRGNGGNGICHGNDLPYAHSLTNSSIPQPPIKEKQMFARGDIRTAITAPSLPPRSPAEKACAFRQTALC